MIKTHTWYHHPRNKKEGHAEQYIYYHTLPENDIAIVEYWWHDDVEWHYVQKKSIIQKQYYLNFMNSNPRECDEKEIKLLKSKVL